ncbi:A/G-specific adenine glycosylase [Aestuariimicrobium sp. Y1814]|uniref:A/G-specific adenine glycosylase n=1 Tax=Aestuariimicrobium sp. Y1814 TaxID=3418742 RepID=UPI003DA7467C
MNAGPRTTDRPRTTARPRTGRPRSGVIADVLEWYDRAARDLPWRREECTPWGVMVSEFMLQQTPVNRVLGPWHTWLQRWPTPSDLAAEDSAEAVAAWGRLGYPRRALRLHAAARVIRDQHAGRVPDDLESLRALPGVGEYTAAAIASFGFGRRTPVVDTNVRRVLARLELPEGEQSPGVADRQRALDWLPEDAATAARWAAASMELGALVCTARSPDCGSCPVRDDCAWLAAGRPESSAPRRTQTWEGTDRQCRGVLLAALRAHRDGLTREQLVALWEDAAQAERCLDSLLDDGLARSRDEVGAAGAGEHHRITL